jgi:hypothetical protein
MFFASINVRIHGDSCHDFLIFYVYYDYAFIISTATWYSNAIAIFNINCIIGTGSCFIFTYSCDLHGTTQWEFKDTRVLKGPVGISVDNDGNVYAVCFHSDKVVVISSDGKRHRQLLLWICMDDINKSHLFLLNKNHSINWCLFLLFYCCPLVTSNRKADLLCFTTCRMFSFWQSRGYLLWWKTS